jgi:PAS domain S-box-containing protein
MTPSESYKMFLDSVSDYAVFFTDLKGRITEWSIGAERVLGFSSDEAIGENIRIIFTPESAEAADKERIVANREGQAVDERWHLKKGGARFFALGRLLALKDEAGKVQGYTKILRDWTEQKKAEEDLKTSNERFRAFFELAGSGNLEIQAETLQIISVNRRIADILGYSPSELIALKLLDLVHPEDREACAAQLQGLIGHQTAELTGEKRYVSKKGSIIWLYEALTLLPEHEGNVHLFAVVQDITLLKAQEQYLESRVAQRTQALEDKSRQMEEMCYTVAHDLRAPLRGISGYAALLLDNPCQLTEAEKTEFLQRIVKSASLLDHLILDLLGFNRAQQVPLTEESFFIEAAVREVLQEFEAEIEKSSAEIKIEEPLGSLHTDRVAFTHILRNYLDNALKFRRREGRPAIRVYSEYSALSVRVTVEDNGIGIPPAYAEKIFLMFEKLPTPQSHLGTGVGLAIVSRLAIRLGGRAGVSPNPAGGSRFWFDIPHSAGQRSQPF